jgi:hypothetical protein
MKKLIETYLRITSKLTMIPLKQSTKTQPRTGLRNRYERRTAGLARKKVAALGTAVALLALLALPAMASTLQTAQVVVTPECNTYAVTVKGTQLNQPNAYVNYSFNITSCASPVTITGSIPVCPNDQAGDFSVSQIQPLGQNYLSGESLSGSATLFTNNGANQSQTIPIAFVISGNCPPGPAPTPPPCSAQSSNSSNFNGTPINGGSFIWFNANFKPQGIPSTGATIYFTNSTISFTADQPYNLPVPDAQITFSPSATCATTSFDSTTNTWLATVPISGTDNIFLSGLTFPVPASFANVKGKVSGQVVWQGTFSTDTPGVSIQGWAWGAAVYTSFTTDYTRLNVKPTHQNACGYNNGDQAGTPENQQFQSYVVGGATGGGGSNFTGSWSGTVSVSPACN